MALRSKRKAFASFLLAGVLSTSLFAGVAYADSVTIGGADFDGSVSDTCNYPIAIVTLDGQAGGTVYVEVLKDGKQIANRLEYTMQGGSGASAGQIMLDIEGFSPQDAQGYTVNVYSDINESDCIYSGALNPIYAHLSDAGSEDPNEFLGFHTLSKDESRDYNPRDSYYNASTGSYYVLDGGPSTATDGSVVYNYKKVEDPETAVTGTISYIDFEANLIRTQTIPGIEKGTTSHAQVAQEFIAEDGKRYRTIFPKDSITINYPGQINYTIYCKEMTNRGEEESFLALIKYYDQAGNLVMTDQVTVDREVRYTLPESFYQTNAQGLVTTYNFKSCEGAGEESRYLDLKPGEHKGSYEVKALYNYVEPGQPDNWKIVCFDGENGSKLSEKTIEVQAGETANYAADQTLTVDGKTYNLYGASSYSFTNDRTSAPVTNVYYIPEGYKPPQDYEITVQCVDFANNKVLDSMQVPVSYAGGDVSLATRPDMLAVDGAKYVKLAGQTSGIHHGYFNKQRTYTYYYRDEDANQYADVVVRPTRVIGGNTSSDGDASNGVFSNDGVIGLADDAALASTGENTLLSENGNDTATEYELADETNPLAGGNAGMTKGKVIVASVLAIAVAAVVVFVVRKRRSFKSE